MPFFPFLFSIVYITEFEDFTVLVKYEMILRHYSMPQYLYESSIINILYLRARNERLQG